MPKAVIVIVGITGDLAKRYILPSLYQLMLHEKVDDVSIIGIGTRETSEKKIVAGIKPFLKKKNGRLLKRIEQQMTYLRGDVTDIATFTRLKEMVDEKRGKGQNNLLFYLATLPRFFVPIVGNIKSTGLHKESKGWSRFVFEKPFGDDGKSARDLNAAVQNVFSEQQIYRVDHYLGKELVRNMAVLRFTNTMLEPVWNSKYIDHVQIHLHESLGVEDRAKFFDAYGTVKDVVQNHVLQLLALTAMEEPKKLHEKHMRDKKAQVLSHAKVVKSVFGQYKGYTGEKGIDSSSKTETFAALKVKINTPRWKGTPFYLLTGKKLAKKQTLIYVRFKNSQCHLFDGVCPLRPNHLVISVQPDEGFYLTMNAKNPGSDDITQVKMDFCHACEFGPKTPSAYENVIENVLKGDQSAFVRADEVAYSWDIVDPILKKKQKIHLYESGSIPTAAKELIHDDERSWFI